MQKQVFWWWVVFDFFDHCPLYPLQVNYQGFTISASLGATNTLVSWHIYCKANVSWDAIAEAAKNKSQDIIVEKTGQYQHFHPDFNPTGKMKTLQSWHKQKKTCQTIKMVLLTSIFSIIKQKVEQNSYKWDIEIMKMIAIVITSASWSNSPGLVSLYKYDCWKEH